MSIDATSHPTLHDGPMSTGPTLHGKPNSTGPTWRGEPMTKRRALPETFASPTSPPLHGGDPASQGPTCHGQPTSQTGPTSHDVPATPPTSATSPQASATSHDVPSTPRSTVPSTPAQPTIDASGFPTFGLVTPPPKASSSTPLSQDSADVHYVRATSRQWSLAVKANATAVLVNAVGNPDVEPAKKAGARASRGRALAHAEQDTEIAQTLLVSGCRRCRC